MIWKWLVIMITVNLMIKVIIINDVCGNKNNNNRDHKNIDNNSSEPEYNIQVAPLKYWVYEILKSETNYVEITTWFTTHYPVVISQTSKKN